MAREVPLQIGDYNENLDIYPESELIFGLTYAVGTDYRPVQECIERILKYHGYSTQIVRVSALIANLTDQPLKDGNAVLFGWIPLLCVALALAASSARKSLLRMSDSVMVITP